MHILNFLYPALFLLPGATTALRSDSSKKVKLSNVQSLTLRKGLHTSHRRVSAIPQLKCIGGSGRGFYEVDVMRCKNSGSDYNDEDIQWTCQASLPEEFKLGSTDVICEGFDYPEDPYILKGSCGVEYRLVLTEKGERKYGRKKPWFGDGDDDSDDNGGPKTFGQQVATGLFFMLFVGVFLFIVYNAFLRRQQGAAGAGGWGGNRPGWGGGGGGWGNDNDDPPPPYEDQPGQPSKRSYGTSQGWRPGFWSGALGAGAAGYAAGRAMNRGNQTNSGWGNGEGSSRSSSSSPSYSSTRHESTGFGSTSRR